MKVKRFLAVLLTIVMCICSMPVLVTAEETAVAEVSTSNGTRTFTSFQDALDIADANDTIKILKDTKYGTSITKKINIIVPNGVTFNVEYYSRDDGVIQVMEPNIKVENGGIVKFSRYRLGAETCYLVMNGNMTIDSGATVEMCAGTTLSGVDYSGVLFLGTFKNNGTLDCIRKDSFNTNANGSPYIKYGQEVGTILNGYPIYNLCITTPSDETITEKTIKVTAITGKAEVSETLTVEIDGFGNSANLPEAMKKTVMWYDDYPKDSKYNSFQYTVESSDIGKKIGASFKGVKGNNNYLTSEFPYCYMLYKDGQLITLRNGSNTADAQTDVVKANNPVIYLGGANAIDTNSGKSAQEAVASFSTAVKLVSDGGDIILCGDVNAGYYNFIDKSINFKALDNSTKPALISDYGLMFIIANESNITLSFAGIDFNYEYAIFGALQDGATFNFENIQTSGTGIITSMIAPESTNGYKVHNVNIKNSNDLNFNFQVKGTTAHVVTLDNSSITNVDSGSLGNVKLLNNSTLSTTSPIQTLTADNTNNKIKLLEDEESKKALPIKIEGTITVSDTPIELVYDRNISNDDTLVTSENGNSLIAVDNFKITKSGVSLKQMGNDVVAMVDAPEEYTINYANGTAQIYVPTAGNYTVIFADYEGNALNKVVTSPLTVEANETGTKIITPQGITLGNSDKIMLWSTLGGMCPLTGAYVIK